jgi:hypothetical protein
MDSVTGVPTSQDVSCTACRVGFPLHDVSQPQVLGRGSALLTTVVPLGILGAILYSIYHSHTSPSPTNN